MDHSILKTVSFDHKRYHPFKKDLINIRQIIAKSLVPMHLNVRVLHDLQSTQNQLLSTGALKTHSFSKMSVNQETQDREQLFE